MPDLDDGIETRCVVLTGEGRAFSAGYDIAAHPRRTASSRTPRRWSPIPSTRRWRPSPATPGRWSPRSTATRSAAAWSWRSAATSGSAPRGAKLGMPPAKLGLIYGHTGLQRFIDTIGVPRTKELFLTGRNVTAERAEQIGLVHEVVDDDEVEAASLELAAEIAGNAPISMQGNKRAIDTLNAQPTADPRAGARADRAARVLLRLRGLPRGDQGLRREAKAASGRAARRARARAAAARSSPRAARRRPAPWRATRSCRRSARRRPEP